MRGMEYTQCIYCPQSFLTDGFKSCLNCRAQLRENARKYYRSSEEVRQRACERTRNYRKDNLEKVKATEKNSERRKFSRLKRRMKIHEWDIEHYREQKTKQAGRCGNRFCMNIGDQMDHNHKTLKPRALLCGNCNTALGMVDDSPLLLRGLVEYLQEYPM